MLAVGIIVVVEVVKRKWITAMRIASSATLIFFGLFLISGRLISVIIGGSLVIAGIITPLRMSPGVEMGGRKKRVATYFMIVVTAVWAVALCIHIQEYNRFIQECLEIMEARGLDPGFFDPLPVRFWGAGPNLEIAGLIILVAWMVSISLMYGHR